MFRLRFVLALVALLCMAGVASAEEVKTAHYTIELAGDWQKAADPIEANGASVLMVNNTKGLGMFTVAITPVKMDAKALADATAKQMPTKGFTITGTEKVGDSYKAEFVQDAKKLPGVNYYTSNGEVCSVLTIVGKDKSSVEAAVEYLEENLKPADPKLFPSEY